MIAVLKKKEQYGSRDTVYTFECEEIAAKAKPGQFVEVRINEDTVPFLRRPISIFDVDGVNIKLLVRTVGKGTEQMTSWKVGQKVDILGPLGNGFTLPDAEAEEVLLIGGGIGVAPFGYLAKTLLAQKKHVSMLFLPARDAAVLEVLGELQEKMELYFCNNRQELPEKLEQILNQRPDIVYTCGPNAMMAVVAKKCKENGVRVQVSMEERMGCGIGICVGCVVPIRTTEGFEYKKACKDGPVFWGEEVIFDE